MTDTGMPADPPWGALRPSLGARAVMFLSRNTILGRGFPRRILSGAFQALHTGAVDVELWGTRVRLHPFNNVVERKALLRPDVFDAQERAVLRIAVAVPGCVFVDVGGNAGLYSLDAALHAGEGARILTIEPDRGLMARFSFNLNEARNGGLAAPGVDVTMAAVAVSDREGEAVLSAAGDEGSRNIVDGSVGGQTVKVRTLAALVQEAGLSRIDILKIDVEGHEDKVLPPFFAAAPRAVWPRRVIIEHLQRAAWRPDCIAGMLERGYRVFKTTRNNTFLERD